MGDRVYSMVHDSCETDSRTEFVVNTRAGSALNYDPVTELVECPWCHAKVALDVILANYQRKPICWQSNNTKEEQR